MFQPELSIQVLKIIRVNDFSTYRHYSLPNKGHRATSSSKGLIFMLRKCQKFYLRRVMPLGGREDAVSIEIRQPSSRNSGAQITATARSKA
jgi:hypothetical protein